MDIDKAMIAISVLANVVLLILWLRADTRASLALRAIELYQRKLAGFRDDSGQPCRTEVVDHLTINGDFYM